METFEIEGSKVCPKCGCILENFAKMVDGKIVTILGCPCCTDTEYKIKNESPGIATFGDF